MSEPYIFAIKPQIHPSPLFVSIILNRMSIMKEIDYSKWDAADGFLLTIIESI